jgi:flagellin
MSGLKFHRDTIPKSAGNFFSVQIGNRVLTADNATDASDLAAKFKSDSDYNFIREQVGLGDSSLELFEVIDIPEGRANASGLTSIASSRANVAVGDVYTSADGKTYRLRTNGADEAADKVLGNVNSSKALTQAIGDAAVGEAYTDAGAIKIKTGAAAGTAIAEGSAPEKGLLTTALATDRVQKLKINFGENAVERGSLYQSRHNVTITDIESAISALDFVDGAAKVVNESRARMGATMSRIEYTINNLMNLVENTEEAKSRVLDTDYAKESAELAKAQILAQAGTAMLAQANQSQQYVLNLLRQG